MIELQRICTNSLDSACGTRPELMVCGARQKSKYEIWCTQATVQRGAQDFSLTISRRMSARVYCASGVAGYPRCCEQ